MKKLNVLLAILAVMCLIGSAGATTYVLNLENAGAAFVNPPPFGEVTVSLIDGFHANVEFTTLAPPPPSGGIDDYSFAIKIGAFVTTSFSVSGIATKDEFGNPTGSGTWNSSPNPGAQTFDGFGQFGLVIGLTVPGLSDIDVVDFLLTNTSVTAWANDDAVFGTGNAQGYHVAAHVKSDLFLSIDGVSNTFYTTDRHPAVPVPPSALLLGSGLLGMGILRFRKSC